jgi:DNA-binding transcriptional LysR family regulator
MDFTLHQLRIFLAVAENASMTRAAEQMHMTQPAVSIQMRNLQDQFPFPLTEVIGRQLYLTEYGREILVKAQEIVDQVGAIEEHTQRMMGNLSGTIKMASVSTGKYVAPHLLSGFLSSHPGVHLKLDVTNRQSVLESLSNNAVDFGLIPVLYDNDSLQSEELFPNKLVLVCSGKNHISTWKELMSSEELPYILREAGSSTRQVMEAFLEKYSWKNNKRLELTSNEAVKQAVIANLGWSIMPLIGLQNELINGQLRLIENKLLPYDSTWHIVWLKNKKLSPAAQEFLSYIRKEKEQLRRSFFTMLDR